MAKQNLGRVSVVPKGEYVGGTIYTKLDIVTYNGSSYIALKDTSASPTDTTAWQLVAEKGETGAKGDKGDHGKDGASTWDALTGKPFESVGDGLTVTDGVLSIDMTVDSEDTAGTDEETVYSGDIAGNVVEVE